MYLFRNKDENFWRGAVCSAAEAQDITAGLPKEAGGEPCDHCLGEEHGERWAETAEGFFDGGESCDAGHVEQAEHREAKG